MRIVIYGATGMVGHGVLMEALDSPNITSVVSVGRKPTGIDHAKLREIVHENFEDFESVEEEFSGVDACFWCLGVSSAGMDEEMYARITYGYTMAAARVLYRQNPNMRFCFLSAAGADETEKGRVMWARVKGRAENALSAAGFREVVVFRPAFIRPQRGSQPRGYLRLVYGVFGIFYPLLRAVGGATSSVEVGKAMIAAALGLSEEHVLNSAEINRLAARLPV